MTKRIPYNEMETQIRFIYMDKTLTPSEIHQATTVLLEFYRWDVKEFFDIYCNMRCKDIQNSLNRLLRIIRKIS